MRRTLKKKSTTAKQTLKLAKPSQGWEAPRCRAEQSSEGLVPAGSSRCKPQPGVRQTPSTLSETQATEELSRDPEPGGLTGHEHGIESPVLWPAGRKESFQKPAHG